MGNVLLSRDRQNNLQAVSFAWLIAISTCVTCWLI